MLVWKITILRWKITILRWTITILVWTITILRWKITILVWKITILRWQITILVWKQHEATILKKHPKFNHTCSWNDHSKKHHTCIYIYMLTWGSPIVCRGGNRSGSRCPASLLATCTESFTGSVAWVLVSTGRRIRINGEKKQYQQGMDIHYGYLWLSMDIYGKLSKIRHVQSNLSLSD